MKAPRNVASSPLEVRKCQPSVEWKTHRSDLSQEQLVRFGDAIRRAVVHLMENETDRSYRDLFLRFGNRVMSIVRAQGNSKEQDEDGRLSFNDMLVINVSKCIPTEENLSLLEGFHDEMMGRRAEEEELKKLKKRVVAFRAPRRD